MPKLELGQKVRFKKVLRRVNVSPPGRQFRQLWEWVPVAITHETEGIVAGTRTVYKGESIWGGGEEASYFKASGHTPAVLVAYDMRKKPYYVRPEDLEVIDE